MLDGKINEALLLFHHVEQKMSQTLSRAFGLLELVNTLGLASVKELSSRSGLPKPTVSRMLKTLKKLGYVDQATNGESYRVALGSRMLSNGYDPRAAIIKVSDTPMSVLTAKIEWPLALGWCVGDDMLVAHSTIPQSPLAWYRTTLNMRLPILWSAMGLTYTAHSNADEQQRIMSLPKSQEIAWSQDHLEYILIEIRRKGYGFRSPGFGQRTASISVPIMQKDSAKACLSLTYFGMAITEDAIVKEHLADLKATAAEIANSIADLAL
jgi:IclR family transcriptional regulator, mhp operon transcriptional activator